MKKHNKSIIPFLNEYGIPNFFQSDKNVNINNPIKINIDIRTILLLVNIPLPESEFLINLIM